MCIRDRYSTPGHSHEVANLTVAQFQNTKQNQDVYKRQEQGDEGRADQHHTAASHELLDALRLGAGAVSYTHLMENL